MKYVVAYLLVLLGLNAAIHLAIHHQIIPISSDLLRLAAYSILFGLLGALVHCLRAIYIHRSIRNDWDDRWIIWYYLRPVVGGVMGLVSFVFIKAGLIVFASESSPPGNARIAYMAVAFLGGFNVRNFLQKIEDVSRSVLGIEPSAEGGSVKD